MAEYEQLTLPFAPPDKEGAGRKKTSRTRRTSTGKTKEAPATAKKTEKTEAATAAKGKRETTDKTAGKTKRVPSKTSRTVEKDLAKQVEKTTAQTAVTQEKSRTKAVARASAKPEKDIHHVPDAIRKELLALPAEKRFAIKEASLEAQPPQVGFYTGTRKILTQTEGALYTGSSRGVYAVAKDGTKYYAMWYPVLKLIEQLILDGTWISAAEERRIYRAKEKASE